MAPLSKNEVECDIMVDDDSTSNTSCYDVVDEKMATVTTTPTAATRKTTKSRRKYVSFSQYSQQYIIPNLEDLTYQERLNSYLSMEDYARIKNDNACTLHAMNHGMFPDNDQETFRGLENGMNDYYFERKHMIAQTVSTLLAEQDKYFLLDPIWIENVYTKLSSRSLIYAIRAGDFDAREVGKEAFDNDTTAMMETAD
jgi:hypothetical protein